MPRSTREWCKRKLKMCMGNIDTCNGHLNEVGVTYAAEHPEIARVIVTVIESNLILHSTIKRLEESI